MRKQQPKDEKWQEALTLNYEEKEYPVIVLIEITYDADEDGVNQYKKFTVASMPEELYDMDVLEEQVIEMLDKDIEEAIREQLDYEPDPYKRYGLKESDF